MSGIWGWEFVDDVSRSAALEVATPMTVFMLLAPHLLAWAAVRQQRREKEALAPSGPGEVEFKRLMTLRKAELTEKATAQGIEVPSSATKAQILGLMAVYEDGKKTTRDDDASGVGVPVCICYNLVGPRLGREITKRLSKPKPEPGAGLGFDPSRPAFQP
jgi:hypothetical protein